MMKEWILAALPWVLTALLGLALAFLLGHEYGKRRHQPPEKQNQREPDEPSKDAENYMTEGMCLGLCLGTALGSSGLIDLPIGVSLGMLFGLVIGMNIPK